MPHVYETDARQPTGRFGIVVSRYNESITSKLYTGAVAQLTELGVVDQDIHVAWVPGAFEIPIAAARMARSGHYAAVICLGAVIKGETTHDEHINRAVSLGIIETSLSTGTPVLFGVLTCDTLEQAIHRSGGQQGNKGAECAVAAVQMANLLAQLP